MSHKEHFLSLQQLSESDSFILFYSSQILVRDEEILWSLDQIGDHLNDSADLILLQRDADTSVIAVSLQQDISAILQAELNSLRSLLFFSDQEKFLLAGRASQLVDWYKNHRFCGTCGMQTVHHGNERTLVCDNCSLHFFPRISPCVIMLVTKGDKMLLARSARFNSNFYSCLAGFIEIGETPEETVHREVKEEVDLQIKNVRYISSQSWPFPSQLMLGFLAEYDSGDIVPEQSEIADAKWFDSDSLPNVPSQKISVAGKLIRTFMDEVKKKQAC
ncbi:MAG: NAD(+) diphosphatase [SAR86 cluster bacterium]|uniref:NAD(+) diphosphatase n=1 Tax=SAR86 cluster bacterium TaxID=2030880 RepID=A0A2A4WXM3_9GAMM|nr:MAG: NAD(+) diphosphatase [SAR86 cluster bacterium]